VVVVGGLLLFACAYGVVRGAHILLEHVEDLLELVPAVAMLGALVVALATLIAYETVHFAELRDRLRHQLAREG
jgi:hypothetical protein